MELEDWINEMASALSDFAQEQRANVLAEDYEPLSQKALDAAFNRYVEERR